MNVSLPKGKYIIAVSGGVDSVVLLDVLATSFKTPDYTFVVAHFDHGIRRESHEDAVFVEGLAKKYDLTYELGSVKLGKNASEQSARTRRYDFLRGIMKYHNAAAILTAHHEDDLIETMLMHLQRGTGRHGLSPMARTADIIRPLLGVAKDTILQYAHSHALLWREDSTNKELTYKRNRIRKMLKQKLDAEDRAKLLSIYMTMFTSNNKLDEVVSDLLRTVTNNENEILRSRFVVLPYKIAKECVKLWLQKNGISQINESLVSKCVVAVKTLEVGKKIDCTEGHFLHSLKTTVKII
jgi:tRNA(Ile)-lysidine synthetase-like protein